MPGVVALICSANLLGNGLEDCRAALEKLKASEPVRARVTQESSGQFKDEGDLRTRKAKASLVAEDEGAGRPLRLVYDDAALTEAGREQGGRRDASGPGDAIRDLSALRILELLRPADRLLEDLQGAQLSGETRDTRNGQPARILDLKLAPPKSVQKEKGFHVTRSARLWIDDAGAPIFSEITTHTEVHRFIFKVRFDEIEKSDYGRAGNRFVTRKRENQNTWKAWIVGEGSQRSVTTVEPLPVAREP